VGGNQPGTGNPRIERSIIGGLASRVTRRLRYVEIFQLASTTTVVYRAYALNGLYDPYLGTGGHQPSGFDTYMSMYGFYNVTKTTARMSYFNDATGTSQPAAFGMIASTNGNAVTTAGTITYLMEQGRAVFSDIPAGIVNAPISRGLVSKWSIRDFADGADTRGMATYWGTSSTNPGSLAYMEVFHGSLSGTATGTFTYTIELDYDVEFWGPLPNVNSFKCSGCNASMKVNQNFCSGCGISIALARPVVVVSHEDELKEPPPPPKPSPMQRSWFAGTLS